jgi:hypothetical protein
VDPGLGIDGLVKGDPAEVRAEMEAAGFRVEALLAIEGPASYRPEVDEWMADERARWRWRRSGASNATRLCSRSAPTC